MKPSKIGRIFLVLGIACATCLGEPQQPQKAKVPAKIFSLCELTSNWKIYDHAVVRIKAIYQNVGETSEVYDSDCPNSDKTAWVPRDVENAANKSVKEQLRELIRSDGRAQIIAVGEFDGPKKVDIPSNTPTGVADLMRSVNSRYGHDNKWNFQFIFSKIERVDSTPASTPFPHLATDK